MHHVTSEDAYVVCISLHMIRQTTRFTAHKYTLTCLVDGPREQHGTMANCSQNFRVLRVSLRLWHKLGEFALQHFRVQIFSSTLRMSATKPYSIIRVKIGVLPFQRVQ